MPQSIVYNCHYNELLSKYPDKYFYLAIPDIPYGIGADNMPYLKEKTHMVKQKNGNKINANRNKKTFHKSNWDTETPPQEYFELLQMKSEHQIIFGAEHANWTGMGKGRIKWDKLIPDGVSFKRYEIAYCSFIDYELTIPLLHNGMMKAKSIKEPTIQQGNKKKNEIRIHPCQKPVMLYDIIFKIFGIPGMKVIDTHVGSGSSRISADKFEYDFVGSEIDPIYFKDEEKRYFEYKQNLKLQL